MANVHSLIPVIALCAALIGWQLRTNGLSMSPALLAPLEWMLVSLSYVVLQASLSPISNTAAWVLAIGIAGFSAGAHAGMRLEWRFDISASGRPARSREIDWALVLISAVALVLMLAKALEYYPIRADMQWFGRDSWYEGLRTYLVREKRGSYGWVGYGLGFSFTACCYLILRFRRGGSLFPAIASVIVSCGFVVLGTGRTFILLLVCLLLSCALPNNRMQRLYLLALVPLLASGIFMAIPFLGGRMSFETLKPLFELYFIGPLESFAWGVDGGLPPTNGAMTFRTIWAVLNALGLHFEVVDMIQPNSPTRLAGNVYTVFMPYFRDFGKFGVGLFFCAIGFVHGVVFKQAMRGRPLMMVVNGVLFYALVMQFFQDQYFGLLSQWIQIVGWMYLFVWLRPLPEAAPRTV